ncbi:hypothetical protein GGI21_000875 [Coemansia aciculifera]|uniref:Uncharacterized protein n=1 Tax=Coemansia aciculifera TaxID=417176 RepID=A0ACC1LV13_9FUNG|nr:hypothetical protein IWW38_005600 [Coemansia aciculifera]KAJ2910440.1 hypothetical protein GGI21_000875 [Coemansia aciculifera]
MTSTEQQHSEQALDERSPSVTSVAPSEPARSAFAGSYTEARAFFQGAVEPFTGSTNGPTIEEWMKTANKALDMVLGVDPAQDSEKVLLIYTKLPEEQQRELIKGDITSPAQLLEQLKLEFPVANWLQEIEKKLSSRTLFLGVAPNKIERVAKMALTHMGRSPFSVRRIMGLLSGTYRKTFAEAGFLVPILFEATEDDFEEKVAEFIKKLQEAITYKANFSEVYEHYTPDILKKPK